MALRFIFLGLTCILMLSVSCSEEKGVFHFRINSDSIAEVSQPISINLKRLKDVGINLEGPLQITQEIDGKEVRLDYQIDSVNGIFWFVHAAWENTDDDVSYRIENLTKPRKMDAHVFGSKKRGDLQMIVGKNPALTYRYEMTYPPEGVDSVYRKSGYIHPIITPKGDTLSRIQPPDHYHHYGMWGPWTHTQIDSQQVDFWNLGDRKGTVLFKEFKDKANGEIFASFTAAQEHIDLLTQKEPQVALNENLEVTLWDLKRKDRYMFDYTSSFSSPLAAGILFEAYRYGGGIGMRFTERWKADNCSVLTSEGKDRLTADGTSARWCVVSGESADGKGKNGILFMSHPKNRAHPEPMRVWPIDANGGRGDMFFEFCPIRHEEWQIEPNKAYELNYRMVVFDGDLSADEAEAYWQSFAHPPEIRPIQN